MLNRDMFFSFLRPISGFVDCLQGDQIVRIFAQWAIVYLEQILWNYNNIPNVWAPFVHEKVMYEFWRKNELGNTLGDFS
jgi:hypothetical protein